MLPSTTLSIFLARFLFLHTFGPYSCHCVQFSSVHFSHSVLSDSLRPHESQHTRPPCPSPTPGVHPDSCPSSQGCHPAISSSVIPFSSCPQSLPASESFPLSQLFAWGSQSTGVISFSIIPSKEGRGRKPETFYSYSSFLFTHSTASSTSKQNTVETSYHSNIIIFILQMSSFTSLNLRHH